MKQALFQRIDSYQDDMISLADRIYDHPELAMQEYFAVETLTAYLREKGFQVDLSVGGLQTAFRAVIENGKGGPSIGLLAEYDALPGVHHACGHHLQGPVMIAALMGLCESLPKELPWKLVLYGTPGEEGGAGKVIMADNGCFRDIDVALMMHGGDGTTYDPTMSAIADFKIAYSDKAENEASSHRYGYRAFDALLLAMNGIEYMREHLMGNARIHYAPARASSFSSGRAEGSVMLRSLNDTYLDRMIERFHDILKGAAMMTDTICEVEAGHRLMACFPNGPLADLLYQNAELAQADRIKPPRGTMGSTDFGNVMHLIPGICARVAFAPTGTGAHSLEWARAGKSEEAHRCIMISAKIIAGMALDLITDPETLKKVQESFLAEREKANQC